jgi:hypothetical protein
MDHLMEDPHEDLKQALTLGFTQSGSGDMEVDEEEYADDRALREATPHQKNMALMAAVTAGDSRAVARALAVGASVHATTSRCMKCMHVFALYTL